jgi:hypothetical protein
MIDDRDQTGYRADPSDPQQPGAADPYSRRFM